MSDLAQLTIDAGVATLTFNRPEARNAMSIELLDASLNRLFELQSMQDQPTVLVITGAGKSFCAGMDLRRVLGDPEAPPQLLNRIADLGLTIRKLPQVTLAKVNGAAIGGGCGIACACDLVVTHAGAKLGFPEVDLGVCPAVVAPMLVRKIGAGRARSVLLSGGTMPGERAHELGIADHLAPSADELDATCDQIVSTLSSGGAAALAATKALLNDLDGSTDESIARKAAKLSSDVIATPEARERLEAAFAKKP